jgi:hypothetical protein
MQMLDAEAILKEHCPKFYDGLVEECSEGFPSPQKKNAYWTALIEKDFSVDAVLLPHTKLNPFAFYVGLKADDPVAKRLLHNYRALKAFYNEISVVSENETSLKQRAGFLQNFYELPAHLLLSQCYFTWTQESKNRGDIAQAKKYAAQAINYLGLAVSAGYGRKRYEVYCDYDASLRVNREEMLRNLLADNLIEKKQLHNHWCVKDLDLNELISEKQKGGCLALL